MASTPDNLLEEAYALLDRNNLSGALERFRQINQHDPNNAEVWLMTGALEGELGASDSAIEHIQRALSIDPQYVDAYLTLAHLHQASGRPAAAIEACKAALDIDAEDSELWTLLSGLNGAVGDLEPAIACAEKALSIDPNSSQAKINLANALIGAGDPARAVSLYRQAIESSPQHRQTCIGLLGYAQLLSGDAATAVTTLRQAIELNPGSPQQHEHLGVALIAVGHHAQALVQFNSAFSTTPSDALRLHIATALEEMGDTVRALEQLKSQEPQAADAALMRARRAAILHRRGDNDAAENLIAPLLDAQTPNADTLLTFARICHRSKRCEHALSLLDDAIESSAQTAEQRSALLFARGRLHDRQGDYADAFSSWQQAHEYDSMPYDADAYIHYVDHLITESEQLETQPLAHTQSSNIKMIFIVGMPRSGSSLIEQILASHPSVRAAGEARGIFDCVDALQQQYGEGAYPRCLNDLSATDISALQALYFARIDSSDSSITHITDKMPHNFQHLALVHRLFPDAAIIHCARNPLDTCLSCYAQHFSGYHGYTRTLESLGNHYRQYERLISFYRDQMALPMMELWYEDLVNNLEPLARELVKHCGLHWHDACLSYYQNPSSVRTASYDQVTQPVYSDSVERWRHYAPYLSGLRSALDIPE